MKRPGPHVFLFGNPVSVIVLCIAAVYCGYEWWNGQIAPLVAIIVILAASYATNANGQYERYRVWKREWDIMEGRAPTRNASRLYARGGPLRIAVGLLVWAAWGYFAITDRDQPKILVALFWLTTLGMVIATIRHFMREREPRRQAHKDMPVSLCMHPLSRSPSVSDAYVALPSYCLILLNPRSGKA
jgi:hypothetical protein